MTLSIDPQLILDATDWADGSTDLASMLETIRQWATQRERSTTAFQLNGQPLPGVVRWACADTVRQGYGVFMDSDGLFYPCDADDVTTVGKCCGVAMGHAFITGDLVDIAFHGLIAIPGFGFVAGSRYYLGSGGAIATSPPSGGYIQRVGWGLSDDSILVEITTPADEYAVPIESALNVVTLTAGEVIGYPRAVVQGIDSKVYKWDISNPDHHGRLFGITRTSAIAPDSEIQVITSGSVPGRGFGFVSGTPYFAGADGAITITPATAGSFQFLGVGGANDTLLLRPSNLVWR
jgi:hypothetical protein